MPGNAVDPYRVDAIVRAEKLAKSYAADGGDIIDLFTTFALFVAQEDESLGTRCLEALERWYYGERTTH